jgi:hypothetical protein
MHEVEVAEEDGNRRRRQRASERAACARPGFHFAATFSSVPHNTSSQLENEKHQGNRLRLTRSIPNLTGKIEV